MNQKLHLFLVEMVVVLVLFAVSAAVCVGILIQAHMVSRESEALTRAVYLAQSAAEGWKAGQKPGGTETAAEDGDLVVRYQTRGNRLAISVWNGTDCVYQIEEVVCLGDS